MMMVRTGNARDVKLKMRTNLLMAMASLGFSIAASAQVAPNQVWQFNGNLNGQSATGSTAIAQGSWTPIFVTNPQGLPGATVLDIPDFANNGGVGTLDESLMIQNNAPANRGGQFVNDWTLMMDIMIPGADDYTSILQTSPNNSDDVDIYGNTHTTGFNLVEGNCPPAAGRPFSPGIWYRLTFRRDPAGIRAFSNGVDITESVNGSAVDNRMSLKSAFHLFGDDTGDNNRKLINSVAYWGTAISNSAILSFGGPTAAGIDCRMVSHIDDQVGCPGGTSTFVVVAGSFGPYSYSWRKGGVPINTAANHSAATATLIISPVAPSSDALYDCVITNGCGSITSNAAHLQVCPANFNCDSVVDFFDYLDFVSAFAGGGMDADFNSDQVVDFFDYLDFVSAFAGGC